jgi:hypothetical protein
VKARVLHRGCLTPQPAFARRRQDLDATAYLLQWRHDSVMFVGVRQACSSGPHAHLDQLVDQLHLTVSPPHYHHDHQYHLNPLFNLYPFVCLSLQSSQLTTSMDSPSRTRQLDHGLATTFGHMLSAPRMLRHSTRMRHRQEAVQ